MFSLCFHPPRLINYKKQNTHHTWSQSGRNTPQESMPPSSCDNLISLSKSSFLEIVNLLFDWHSVNAANSMWMFDCPQLNAVANKSFLSLGKSRLCPPMLWVMVVSLHMIVYAF